jgi:hypothetical protein
MLLPRKIFKFLIYASQVSCVISYGYNLYTQQKCEKLPSSYNIIITLRPEWTLCGSSLIGAWQTMIFRTTLVKPNDKAIERGRVKATSKVVQLGRFILAR